MIFLNESKRSGSDNTPFCILLALIFIVLYFEPVNIFGIKFSYLYKIIVIYFLLISINIYRSKGILPVYENNYRILLYTAYYGALHSVFFSFSREYIIDSIFYGGQKLFAVLLFHWILHKRYSAARLFMFFEFFLLFNVLAALPFLTGLLEPLGKKYDISIIADDLNAFVGVFQNGHVASLIFAMSGVGAYAISCTSEKRNTKYYYLVLTSIFLLFTIFTYARSGWIAIISGLLTVFWVVSKSHKKFDSFKVLISLLGVSLIVFPQISNYIEPLKMRALGQSKYLSHSSQNLNRLSSGRLSVWATTGQIYLNSNILEKLTGIGEKELKSRMHQRIERRIFAHNGFINILLVDGLIGLLTFLCLIINIYLFFSSLVSDKYRVLCLSIFVCWLVYFFFQGGENPIASSLLFLLVSIAVLAPNNRVNIPLCHDRCRLN